MHRGSKAKYCEMERKFESLLMEWVAKHDVELANAFLQRVGGYESKDKQA